MLRVIKKLRPKKLRNFQRKNKEFRENKGSFDSTVLKSLLSNTQNSLPAEDSGVNSLANKVLLQAVLETENNVGGDVEESIRSQIFITPKSLPNNDITISRVEKVGPNTAAQKASATSNEVSTRKIVLPAQGSVQLRQAEIRSDNDGGSRKVYTLPPKVLQPIGFVHPSFSL